MKRLSLRQAQACENAITPRCRCRCGGALHGARRGVASGYDAGELPPRDWFAELPESDPHKLTSAEEIAARRKARDTVRQLRAQLKRLEGDRRRLIAWAGPQAHGVQELTRRAVDVEKRINWHEERRKNVAQA